MQAFIFLALGSAGAEVWLILTERDAARCGSDHFRTWAEGPGGSVEFAPLGQNPEWK